MSDPYLHKHVRIRRSRFNEMYYDHEELFIQAGLTLGDLEHFHIFTDVYYYVHKKMLSGYYAIYIRQVEVLVPPHYIDKVSDFDSSNMPQIGDILKSQFLNQFISYSKIISRYLYIHLGVIHVEYVCIDSSTMNLRIISHYDEVISPDDYAMLEILKYGAKQKTMLDNYARDVTTAWRKNQGLS